MSDPTTDVLRTEEDSERLGLTQLAVGEVPAEVESWLARLALLYGVPFDHVVADDTMLPPESIRFFYLDANWVEAMVDGAFSVGVHSDRDLRFHRVLHTTVREATAVASGTLRRTLRGEQALDAPVQDTRVRGGFLLRSEIVSGWPGIEVVGYAGAEAAGPEVALLRLDRIAPDLLLALFDEVPGLIVLNEPREGLHFGVTSTTLPHGAEAAGPSETFSVTTRDLSQDVAPPSGEVTVSWRGASAHGRLDLAATAASVERDERVQTLVAGREFGPGDFAAQMVSTAASQHFVPTEDV